MGEEKELTLGSYLRAEREKRNISLEAISRATKITLKTLEAMERDEFHLLPPPVFVRGFLRAYALYVGLDPQKVLEMYAGQSEARELPPLIKKSPPPRRFPPLAKILVILLLIIIAGIILFSLSSSPPPSAPPLPQSSPEVKTKVPLEKPPAAVSESPPPPALPPASTAEKPLTLPPAETKKERRHVLKIKAIEKTWLRLRADEGKEIEALLQPKEVASWTARRQFKITIGNAGGVELTFNGIRQGRLGESGQVVHLLLPPEVKKRERSE